MTRLKREFGKRRIGSSERAKLFHAARGALRIMSRLIVPEIMASTISSSLS